MGCKNEYNSLLDLKKFQSRIGEILWTQRAIEQWNALFDEQSAYFTDWMDLYTQMNDRQ